MSIKKFIEKVLNIKSNELQKYSLGKLSNQQMKQVKEATGLDLRNYTRTIDSFGINHVLKKHGDHNKEKKRGQIAVIPEDFQKIKEMLIKPESIRIAGKAKRGEKLIEYRKRISVEYIYIEEKRRNKLVMKTLFKRK